MIRLGDSGIELELVPARSGDEGWTEHYQVFRCRGRHRALLGYAVNPLGAATIAVMAGVSETQKGAAGRGLMDLRDLVAQVAALMRLPGPPSGPESGQDRRSPPGSTPDPS